MKTLSTPIFAAFVAVFFLLSGSVYTVKQTERAILLRLGEMVETDMSPGLHFKIPGFHRVKKFDGRVLTYNTPIERYTTSENKALLVEAFIGWKIVKGDVKNFFTATRGDEKRAGLLLMNIISKKLRDEFGKRTIQEVVSGVERDKITQILVESANVEAKRLGIEIIEVRIKRIDLPSEVSQSVYARMETARKKVAGSLRSQGMEIAKATRAEADRKKTVLLAEANRTAEILRGEGDAKAAEIYAAAYGKNPEFFALYRSLEAYRNSIKNGQDILVLKPEGDFFKYFNHTKPK